ncbi:MAG: SRPBCC domain-containing protein [Rivularia sp. ALOHA_DT_140]|nr:SRPBCC domain-containing protein [Rivularia sp. ALOHA_DT_140]
MIKLETETIIAAPPQQVWNILIDFESYPEWNPMILEAKGKAEVAAKLKLKVSAPDGSGSTYSFKAAIAKFEPGEILAWKGAVPGILSGFHYWNPHSAPQLSQKGFY